MQKMFLWLLLAVTCVKASDNEEESEFNSGPVLSGKGIYKNDVRISQELWDKYQTTPVQLPTKERLYSELEIADLGGIAQPLADELGGKTMQWQEVRRTANKHFDAWTSLEVNLICQGVAANSKKRENVDLGVNMRRAALYSILKEFPSDRFTMHELLQLRAIQDSLDLSY